MSLELNASANNQRGFIIFQLLFFLLVLVGIWSLWQSSAQGRLSSDARTIFNDYSEIFTKYILPKTR